MNGTNTSSPHSPNHVSIQGVRLRLPEPFQGRATCHGLNLAKLQLEAAWFTDGTDDPPMSPRIVGLPGVGKTTLALSVAQSLQQEVYVMQATSDLRPEDLLVQPVLRGAKEIEYVASPLLAAVIRGGVCVLDEGNRMSEKCWATLASLLDNRRYVESVLAGVRVPAHAQFRFVTTMNDDSSAFDLPEYVTSRLVPKIELEPLSGAEIMASLAEALPQAEEKLLRALVDLLAELQVHGHDNTVRDAVQMARYVSKRLQMQSLDSSEQNTQPSLREVLLEAVQVTLGAEVADALPQAHASPTAPGGLRLFRNNDHDDK